MCESDLKRIALEFGLVGAYSLLEYWLGKTKKTQAASLVELAIRIITRKGIRNDQED